MKLPRLILVFLIILLSYTCERPPEKNTSLNTNPEITSPRNDLTGLGNFAKVSETLYRGAQPGKEGFMELKKIGIKTIVNLRALHSDEDMIEGLGFQYVSIPFSAGNTDEDNIIKFLKVITNSQNHPVFVHCQHGSDRTGMMVAVYRMYVQGWTNEKAIAELSNFGFHEIYQDIRKYLSEFNVKTIQEKVESAPSPR